MSNHATPNLPSRDFDLTERFYQVLGFETTFRNHGWMIMQGGKDKSLWLEFFPYPDLDPAQSSFGACFRLDDLDSFYAQCQVLGLPQDNRSIPRISPPRQEASGLKIIYLNDLDGSLIRCIENPQAA